jgi:hypothetical protein
MPLPSMAASFEEVVTDDLLAKPMSEWASFEVSDRGRYIGAFADKFGLTAEQAGIFGLCMSAAASGPKAERFLVRDMAAACILYTARRTTD